MVNFSNEPAAINIAVRERQIDFDTNFQSAVTYTENKEVLFVHDHPFMFDYVFKPETTQTELFERLAKPLIYKLIEGFCCTIIAYGQTGTGKTYSMGLNANEENIENVGIIPRCLDNIFELTNAEDASISVSFIEIYNEKVFDILLDDCTEQINTKGYKFIGSSKVQITNAEDGFQLLKKGNKIRHVRPTKLNPNSSRSHAVFTIYIENKTKSTKSCINLVDLAGSEGVRRTGHEGVALAEGVNINQGLLSIGKVLQALSLGKKVIPYRDSILSLVLQDSLNSKSYLTVLACISPFLEDTKITLSTLRFAQNAKCLRNNPQINSVLMDIKKSKIKTPLKSVTNNIVSRTPYQEKILKRNPKHDLIRKKSSLTFSTPLQTNCLKPKLSGIKYKQFSPKNLSSSVVKETKGKFMQYSNQYAPRTFSDSKINKSKISFRNSKPIGSNTLQAGSNPNSKKCLNMDKNDETVIEKSMTVNERPSEKVESIADILNTTFDVTPLNLIESNFNEKRTSLEYKAEVEVANTILNYSKNELDSMRANNSTPKPKSEEFMFKIPQSLNIKLQCNCSTVSQISKQDDTKIPKENMLVRRSLRLSIMRENRTFIDESNIMNESTLTENKNCRRSLRLSLKPIEKEKPRKVEKKVRLVRNSFINEYFNNDIKHLKNAKEKHAKAIFNLLNTGSIKELQILPQVGVKTAYQLITFRSLNGKFKSFKEISVLPIWRGKAWERFILANNIEMEKVK